jgi:hypothetical protein
MIGETLIMLVLALVTGFVLVLSNRMQEQALQDNVYNSMMKICSSFIKQ